MYFEAVVIFLCNMVLTCNCRKLEKVAGVSFSDVGRPLGQVVRSRAYLSEEKKTEVGAITRHSGAQLNQQDLFGQLTKSESKRVSKNDLKSFYVILYEMHIPKHESGNSLKFS